jgi:molybdate transport repressor ModE-like protein
LARVPMALLAGVRETGSLSASAKAMGMSYTKAMRILHDAEHALGCSLTVRSIGGEKGGSSSLTPEAEDFLHRYEEWRQGVTAAANAGFSAAFAGVAGVPRLGCVVMANGEATRFWQAEARGAAAWPRGGLAHAGRPGFRSAWMWWSPQGGSACGRCARPGTLTA